MFTGIVEETGIVQSLEEQDEAWRLIVKANIILNDIKLGDSIAINGCCLTVISIDEYLLSFDLLEESINKTSIKDISNGSLVNLERAVMPTSRMGGHIVTGHIDGVGKIKSINNKGKDTIIEIKINGDLINYLKYIIPKGCVTIDGISLTIYEVSENGFSIWLVPHTLQVTNLKDKKVDDLLNIEFDIVAKYLEQLKISTKN